MRTALNVLGTIVGLFFVFIFIWAWMQKREVKSYVPNQEVYTRGERVQINLEHNGFEGLYDGCQMYVIAQQATDEANEVWIFLQDCKIMPGGHGHSTVVLTTKDIEHVQ